MTEDSFPGPFVARPAAGRASHQPFARPFVLGGGGSPPDPAPDTPLGPTESAPEEVEQDASPEADFPAWLEGPGEPPAPSSAASAGPGALSQAADRLTALAELLRDADPAELAADERLDRTDLLIAGILLARSE